LAVPENAARLAEKMRHAFAGLEHQLRENAGQVDEPQLKVLFEESAEVMGAIATTFEDYQRGREPAWREAG